MDIYFTDFFRVSPTVLERYGAFNISLINDLPLFVDPFLLFNSRKRKYQELHRTIIQYVTFLRDRAVAGSVDVGLLESWYTFPEVRQNWLGFSRVGNRGSGLRSDFAQHLHGNLHAVFSNFGIEKITRGSHLEKLCLIKEGIGRDKISDFATNLIKEFLATYTQEFALSHIDENLRQRVWVDKVRFNYVTESWEREQFELPFHRGDYILLTPKDLLTRDEIWINRSDLINDFNEIPIAIPDAQLRSQINNYLRLMLPKEPKKDDIKAAVEAVIQKFPIVLDYYIQSKEEQGDLAANISAEKVQESETLYIAQVGRLAFLLRSLSGFYEKGGRTHAEAMERVRFLKDVIENKDGYRLFYVDGKPIKREEDLQILYRLTWYATDSDVNREVNNGRGPVDFKISRGRPDATLVEFKLASNSHLERNLQNQVEVYEKASDTTHSIKVIIYFTVGELSRVQKILERLKLHNSPDVMLIDARRDNKISASKA